MSYQKLFVLDRASFLLDAQLLSSQTSGTFTGSSASALGTQSWNMPAGYKAVLTIENEQILLSAMSISGGVVTCTIDTRGYDSTTAATHASGATCEIHFTKGGHDQIQDYLAGFDEGGFIVQSAVTTVASGTSHTISGDKTLIFTVGRVYLFKISGTWYRAVITAVSYSNPTTTITLMGDGLPGSGTVTNAGFEFNQSVNKAIDIGLIKQVTTAPASNPPAGYLLLYAKNGGFYGKDSSGNVRFLCTITASASSSGGVLTLDLSTAKVFEVTLTENISSVSVSNGADGETYTLRIKQVAGLYTVALGASFRFSNTYNSYNATGLNGAVDYIDFKYNSADSKYDVTCLTAGFQTSPTSSVDLGAWFGDGSDGAFNLDGTNTYAGIFSKSGNTYTQLRDVYATTFIVATGVTVIASGFRTYAQTSITLNGTGIVHNDGTAGGAGGAGSGSGQAGGGSGGGGGLVGAFPAGKTGGNGGGGDNGSGHVGTNGSGATGTTRTIGSTPGATGGNGGTNTSITSPTGTGGSGGGGSTNTTTAINVPHNYTFAVNLIDFNGTAIASLDSSAAGGGGGGGAGAGMTGGGGGGGGGAGGFVWLASPIITVGASAIIRSNGGNGGNGGDGFNNANGNGGGGGAGGNGGVLVLIYKTYSNAGTVATAGGTGGTHGIDRSGNTTPSTNGAAGSAGKIYQIQT